MWRRCPPAVHRLFTAPARPPARPPLRREAFALLSGSHPLMPSQLVGDITKKSGLAALKEKRKKDPRGGCCVRVWGDDGVGGYVCVPVGGGGGGGDAWWQWVRGWC